MQIVDIIKYDGNDNNKQWLIYKYPSDEFVLGSQLIVNQGQEALFFRGGQALDLFGAGTHTLSTANLPLLNNFVKILYFYSVVQKRRIFRSSFSVLSPRQMRRAIIRYADRLACADRP